MADPHDIPQQFIDMIHVWAERLLDHDDACPSCLALAMISEGFHLGWRSPGALTGERNC